MFNCERNERSTVFHFHAAEVPSSSLTGVTNASGLPSLWPEALAEALKVNKTLTNINLEGNNIREEGAQAWGSAKGAPLGAGRGTWMVVETWESQEVLDLWIL